MPFDIVLVAVIAVVIAVAFARQKGQVRRGRFLKRCAVMALSAFFVASAAEQPAAAALDDFTAAWDQAVRRVARAVSACADNSLGQFVPHPAVPPRALEADLRP